jgi:hypothetical protein
MFSLGNRTAEQTIFFGAESPDLFFNIAEFLPNDNIFIINIPCIYNNKLTYIKLVSALKIMGVYRKGKPPRKEILKYYIPSISIEYK